MIVSFFFGLRIHKLGRYEFEEYVNAIMFLKNMQQAAKENINQRMCNNVFEEYINYS